MVATPAEVRSLTRQLVPFARQVSLREDVSLYLSGVGQAPSRLGAESLLKGGACALLSWGSAGGLVSGIRPGSIILPKNVIAADQTNYPVNLKWHECLWSRLTGHLDLHSEPLAESIQVLAYPEAKEILYTQTGAIAVDMESASVASVARGAAVPFLAIRAIADSVDQAIPRAIQSAFDGFGRLNSFRVIRGLAKHPGDVLPLVRLGFGFRAAHGSLAAVRRLTDGAFCAP